MRARTSKQTARLAVLTMLCLMVAGIPGAQAADTPGVIVQAGNGYVQSAPIQGLPANFKVATILHDLGGFVDSGNGQSRTIGTWVAWGTLVTKVGANVTERAGMSVGSNDGLRWGPVVAATVSTQGGAAQALNILPGSSFAVDYAPDQTGFNQGADFDIWYMPANANQFSMANDPANPEGCTGPGEAACQATPIRFAQSNDGVTFTQDLPLDQDPAQQLITGSASTGPLRGTNGVTQVIWNEPISFAGTACAQSDAAYPWNCLYVILYRAIGDGGVESLAIAGSNGVINQLLPPAVIIAAPALSPIILSPTGWKNQAVTGQFAQSTINDLAPDSIYYAGLSSGGSSGFGVASFTTSATTDLTPSTPATPSSLFDSVLGGSGRLNNPIAIDDHNPTGHVKIFEGREVGQSEGEFLGYTGQLPAAPLSLAVQSPNGAYRSLAGAKVDMFAIETSPATPLFDNAHFSATIDGVRLSSFTIKPSLVLAMDRPTFELSANAPDQNLADGAHTLSVTLADSASNTATASRSFTLDSRAPQSIVTSIPAGNVVSGIQVADPGSLGTFKGTSDDGAGTWTQIAKMRAVVTNPLGDQRSFDSTNARGWTFTPDLPSNSTSWRWMAPANNSVDFWVSCEIGWWADLTCSPTPDTFFSIPGNYRISFQATDLAGNQEQPTGANTVVVTVI